MDLTTHATPLLSRNCAERLAGQPLQDGDKGHSAGGREHEEEGFSMSAAKSTRKPATSSTGKTASGFTEEIDAIIRNSDDWRGETLSRLRGIVLGAGPAVVEEVKWKKPSRPEGVPVWSLDGIVCIGEMLKNAVRLTFPKGAQMKDPKKLFNARLDSSSVRAIDFREGEKVPEAALRALIVEAVDLNV